MMALSVSAAHAQVTRARARTDQNSAVLLNYLRARKEKLRRVSAHRDSLWVVVSGRDPEQLVLHYLKIASGKVITLRRPDSIEAFIPNDVRWVSLREQGAPFGLLVMTDYTSAGVIGSIFLRLDRDSLATVFNDSGTSCRSAEVRRLESTGPPLLIAYEGDLSGGMCDSNCHMRLDEQFHSTLAWPHVYAWHDSRWADAQRSAPGFYRSVANDYRRAAEWMDSQAGKKDCPETWASSARMREWATRADSLATNR